MRREELQQYAGHTVPDLMPDDLRLLLVGINPGLVSAATGLHFARPGNRFYPALAGAGVLPEDVITAAEAEPLLAARGVGITNVVQRASARADELTSDEIVAGYRRLGDMVAERRPRVVAFLGITTYRIATGDRGARTGRQADTWQGAEVWVAPNPSGLNAHATLDSLARDYRQIAEAAGVIAAPSR